jgi:hypothetical protein
MWMISWKRFTAGQWIKHAEKGEIYTAVKKELENAPYIV